MESFSIFDNGLLLAIAFPECHAIANPVEVPGLAGTAIDRERRDEDAGDTQSLESNLL